MHTRIVNLESKTQLTAFNDFIQKHGLIMDKIDLAIVIESNAGIIATGAKHKNIFKLLAVDPDYQSMGLLPQLITELTYHLFEQGYSNSFIFTTLANKEIFKSLNYQEVMTTTDAILLEKGSSIQAYINELKSTYQANQTKNGAIVINGNPFTLGHQFLIESAAKQVDQLFVFVVEEDASIFPFSARFEMIKRGSAHLDNVIVLPSSFYIISQATFPNYFLRDKDHAFNTYATLDCSIFGYWFKQLNIFKRFVGEEPFDPMTDQYNQTMKKILPTYQMEVIIIPRKANQSGAISASKVRAMLKNDDWAALSEFVPQTTLDYLHQVPHIIEKLKVHDGKH